MAEPVLKKGSTDSAVQDLQEALKILGHDPGPIDSVFGASTEHAVRSFQQSTGWLGGFLALRGSRLRVCSSNEQQTFLEGKDRQCLTQIGIRLPYCIREDGYPSATRETAMLLVRDGLCPLRPYLRGHAPIAGRKLNQSPVDHTLRP
jgi:Putative peptidoglycan binding domain